MRMLKERYKTVEGARKRAAFETGINPFEVSKGYVGRRRFFVVEENGVFRVAYERVKEAK